jgi:hypothetical protein
VAAARGHEALVGLLLDHSARLDLHIYEEEPPELAREGGHLATAKTLLRRGTPIPRLRWNNTIDLLEEAASAQTKTLYFSYLILSPSGEMISCQPLLRGQRIAPSQEEFGGV